MRGRPETPDTAVGRGAARGVRRAPASETANACICYSYYPRKAGQSLHLVPERVKRGIALPKPLDPTRKRKFREGSCCANFRESMSLRVAREHRVNRRTAVRSGALDRPSPGLAAGASCGDHRVSGHISQTKNGREAVGPPPVRFPELEPARSSSPCARREPKVRRPQHLPSRGRSPEGSHAGACSARS